MRIAALHTQEVYTAGVSEASVGAAVCPQPTHVRAMQAILAWRPPVISTDSSFLGLSGPQLRKLRAGVPQDMDTLYAWRRTHRLASAPSRVVAPHRPKSTCGMLVMPARALPHTSGWWHPCTLCCCRLVIPLTTPTIQAPRTALVAQVVSPRRRQTFQPLLGATALCIVVHLCVDVCAGVCVALTCVDLLCISSC
jgi:hypothetical protein